MRTLRLIFILSCYIFAIHAKTHAKSYQSNYNQSKNLSSVLTNILGSAEDNFENIKGKIDSTDHFYTYYEPGIRIPSTELCMVRKSDYGITYFCVVGTYKSGKLAEKNYRKYISKMSKCLPSYYFEADTTDKDYNETLFGKRTPDGFDREAGSVRLVNQGKVFQVYVFFEKGLRLHFEYNKTGSNEPSNKFGVQLNELMNSCKTGFKNEKDTMYHDGPNTIEEPVTKLEGSEHCTMMKGTSGQAKYESVFFKGTDETEAKRMYDELAERIKQSLPVSYIYTNHHSENQPEYQEFAQKLSKSFDYIPVAMLKLVKNEDQYEVVLNISIQSI